MIKKFMNATIRVKLILSFSMLVVVFAAISIVQIVNATNSSDRFTTINDHYTIPAHDVQTAYALLCKATAYANEIGLLTDAAKMKEKANTIEDLLEEAGENAAKVQGAIESEEIIPVFNQAKKDFEAFSKVINEAIAPVLVGKTDDFKLDAEAVEAAMHQFEKSIETLEEELYGDSEELTTSTIGKQQTISLIVVCVLVAVLLITILIAFSVIRSIRIPLKEMEDAAYQLAKGDIDIELKKHYNDEVGRVADSTLAIVENIKRQVAAAEKISNGNLVDEVSLASDKDKLGFALRRIVEDNNRALIGMKEAASQVSSGSEQVAAASQALAQGATEQASSIEEITASINEIASMTRANAEEAGKASSVVGDAKKGAIAGSERMRDMMVAMSEINTASENISKIIKVIDDIAFQTNILALNAAVEAARAGQHGKGFAVVAEEVRNLAGKSAQAAKETAELIEDSIRKVGKGSEIAEETAEALNKIVEAIDSISVIAEGFAKSCGEQATATTQVDQALMQVSTVVQTNSSTSEECAAASEELSAQAVRLLELIGFYRLKGDENVFGAGMYSQAPAAKKVEAKSYIEEKPVPMIALDDGFGKY